MIKVAIRTKKGSSHSKTTTQTLGDHINELQWRLFIVVATFLVIGGAAYPFFDKIVAILLDPLKEGQELVYLTPGGAFSFIIQVCIYVGLIGALPVILYHAYRFVMPAMHRARIRTALGYTIASFLLAAVGIGFAYVVSLPAALYFLSSFDLYHINPMLTVDSYLSFVMTYLLAGALLFQLPLIMMIIDSITPQSPSSLMKHQGKIILGSFIVAAIISPTPDALNQTLLAAPVVVMYQAGIMLVWIRGNSRKQARKDNKERILLTRKIARRAFVAQKLDRSMPKVITGHQGLVGGRAVIAPIRPAHVQAIPRDSAHYRRQNSPFAPLVRQSVDGIV